MISNYSETNLYIPPKFEDLLINKHPYNIIEPNLGVASSTIISSIASKMHL